MVGACCTSAISPNPGRALVFFGGPGGLLDDVPDGELTGTVAGGEFGWSVDSAGDLNADGYADIVVGAPGANGAEYAHVYFGGPGATFDPVPEATLIDDGSLPSGRFGIDVAGAGDLDGDGHDDVLVGNDGGSTPDGASGRAYLFRGGAGATFDPTPDLMLVGTGGENLGISVTGLGDVNGDAADDFFVGAHGNMTGGTQAGRGYVFFGSATGLPDDVADAFFDGPYLGAFGAWSAGPGDINGDAFADLVVGAGSADLGMGRAYVFYGGAPFDMIPDAEITADTPGVEGGWLGRGVGGGDLDADGFADVFVSAIGVNGEAGAVYLFRGGAAPTFDLGPDAVLYGAVSGGGFGAGVASPGDLDGDGYGDLAVGAPAAASLMGNAFVFGGGPFPLGAVPVLTVSGVLATDGVGNAVAAATVRRVLEGKRRRT